MRKKLLLCCLALLLGLVARAAGPLRVDSISINGNGMAMLTQHAIVDFMNPTSEAFEGRVFLLAHDADTGALTFRADTLISAPPANGITVCFDCQLPEGRHLLTAATDAEGREPLCTREVTILQLRKLDFTATFALDMLSEEADGNVLYGSRVCGSVLVRSQDEAYFGAGGERDDDGIVVWLEDEDSGQQLYHEVVATQLLFHHYFTAMFSHDAAFRDGGRYVLRVGYAVPGGREVIASLRFTMRSGAGTYWTADGRVLPLPVGDDTRLTVPAEAVAVDLRGQGAPAAALDVSGANPNCLYYLDLLASLPQGLSDGQNVIRGLQAERIRLAEGHDYFCPLAFQAQFISYLLTPVYDSTDDLLVGRGYSETIVLPFDVSQACLYDVNGDEGEMIHGDMLKVLQYGGHVGDSLVVSQISSPQEMRAYTPYVLGVFVGSSLLFMGENTVVPATHAAESLGTDFHFVGTTVERRLPAGSYVYHPADNSFYAAQDEVLIAPFHAYIDGSGDYDRLNISVTAWGGQGNPSDATAIETLPSSASRYPTTTVSDLTGRRVDSRQLPKGIYIVGGRKVIVK